MSKICEKIEDAAYDYYLKTTTLPTTIYLSKKAASTLLFEMQTAFRYTADGFGISTGDLVGCSYHTSVGRLGFHILNGDTPEDFVTCDYQDYDQYIDSIVAKNMLGEK